MGRRSKTALVLAQEGGHVEVAASLWAKSVGTYHATLYSPP